MKKLSLILAMLICATAVYATSSTAASQTPPAGPMMDGDHMMGKAYCENHHMSAKECKADMEKWKNATPDQRMAMMKERWGKMTPDEKKMAMDHMVMKFKSMDADSQKAALQMMQDSMSK